MVVVSLDGSSMTLQAIAEALLSVKNEVHDVEEPVDELVLREVDFDAEQVALFIDLIQSRMMNTMTNKKWKSIHIAQCSGLVNDAIMACMSSTNLSSFSVLQPIVNAQTSYCLTYGLKYNKQLQSLKLSIGWDAGLSRSLAMALARNVSLQELSIENSSNLEQPGVVMNLSFGLRLNQHLKSLNLDGCYLQDDHVSSLLLALDGHISIKKLSLKKNSCHTKGISAVATLLHANQLEELDLSFLLRQTKQQLEQEQEEEQKEEEQHEAKEEDHEDDQDTETENVVDDAKQASNEDKDDDSDKYEEEKEYKKEDDGDDDNDEVDAEEEEETATQVCNTSLRVLWLAGNGVGDGFLESVMNIFGKESRLEELSLFGNRLSSQGIQRLILKQKLSQLKCLKHLFLGDNTTLNPLDIKDDLVAALQKSYSLEKIMIKNLIETNPDTMALQDLLDHYCRLNVSGRRIMACFEENNSDGGATMSVPLGLWPLILERANRMYQRKGNGDNGKSDEASKQCPSYAADTIYCLLHGPVLYENPNLIPQGRAETNSDEGCNLS
jgi:hypothetical protein